MLFSVFRQKAELHIFGDSSQEVFGAVAFLPALGLDSETPTSFLFEFDNGRVATMKSLSIPKLEFQAARMKQHMERSLDFPSKIFLC